jgi:hypothetical protein
MRDFDHGQANLGFYSSRAVERYSMTAVKVPQGLPVVSIGPEEYSGIGKFIGERALSGHRHPGQRTLGYRNQAFYPKVTVAARVGNLAGEVA